MLVLVLVLLLVPGAAAQDEASPFMIYVFDTQELTLYSVDTASGEASSLDLTGFATPQDGLSVSPTGAHVALCRVDGGGRAALSIRSLPDLSPTTPLDLGTAVRCNVAPDAWSADGSSLAVGLTLADLYGFEAPPPEPGTFVLDVALVDVGSGQVFRSAMMDGLDLSAGTWGGLSVMDYQAEASVTIELYGFEGPGRAVQWDLQNNQLLQSEGLHPLMASIPSTGEVFVPSYDSSLPHIGILGIGYAPFNTIWTGRAGEALQPLHLVFSQFEAVYVTQELAVIEGGLRLAYYDTQTWQAIDRRGQVSSLISGGELIGTPSGAVQILRDNNRFLMTQYSSMVPAFNERLLLDLPLNNDNDVRVVGSSEMPILAGLPPFASADLVAQARSRFPDDCALVDPLPRLAVGSTVLVVDEVPNRVRSEPNISAEVIGEFSRSDFGTVLSGPTCTQGYAWYEIQMENGLVGWTVEGEDGEYFLQP